MSRASLQAWLLADRFFLSAFKNLEVEVVRAQFPHLNVYRSEFDFAPNWSYLLFCASILAPSDIPASEETALRIAQSALLDDRCLAHERDAALVVLDALSNRMAIDLAQRRGRVTGGVEARLGLAQRMDWLRRSLENGLELADGTILHANKFQRRFWTAAQRASWLSVSAPTSAGKSFILAQWLAEALRSGKVRRVVYLAPTRALVQQVENDLRLILAEAKLLDVEISSVPFRVVAGKAEREILVFTQERLHYYLQNFSPGGIDGLIVDEAHKIGDSHRGILLQDVIEQIAKANPQATVLFTAPLVDNPELMLADAPDGTVAEPLRSDDATVNQNLLFLEPDQENPNCWRMSLRRGEANRLLGYFETPHRLTTPKSKMARLAVLADTGEGGILVYADGAAQAEGIAGAIAKLLPEIPENLRVRALDELCKDTIHKDYRLREVLRKGVAFHYGNMPLLLRTEIESLFRDGHVRYMVCTSTLVEGVNLPCRSIIVRAPKKGRGIDMPPADFWNLAGRAGRWGKEFQGNVICIDTQDIDAWGEALPARRSRYRVERTADRLLNDETRLIEYVDAGAPSDKAKKSQDLEAAVSYLTAIRRRHGTLMGAPWAGRISGAALARIDEALGTALDSFDLPNEWVGRHAGISPFAMHRMLTALQNLKQPIDNFLPLEPEEEDAANQYGRIFQLMGHHMTTAFGQGNRCQALGILTTNWMLGHPIKRIIAARIDWNRRKGISQKTATTIRKTLEDVEQIARFQAPRYLACYSDLARHVLELAGMKDKIEAIPDLTLSLEFGVRGPVQLALMALGLSRSSTLAIASTVSSQLAPEQIRQLQTEPSAVMVALQRLRPDEMNLPELVRDEIVQLQTIFALKQS